MYKQKYVQSTTEYFTVRFEVENVWITSFVMKFANDTLIYIPNTFLKANVFFNFSELIYLLNNFTKVYKY